MSQKPHMLAAITLLSLYFQNSFTAGQATKFATINVKFLQYVAALH